MKETGCQVQGAPLCNHEIRWQEPSTTPAKSQPEAYS